MYLKRQFLWYAVSYILKHGAGFGVNLKHAEGHILFPKWYQWGYWQTLWVPVLLVTCT